MKAKRLLLALLIALSVSAVFTVWLSRRVGKAARTESPKKQLYVAAAKSLDAGTVLNAASLQLIEWPASVPITGGFTKASDLVGRTVLYPLPQGELILQRQLGAGTGLTASIPAGMRAMSVRSDEIVGVAGFLLPGTHVDVLMTYHSQVSPEPKTLTVLQDVVVLAAGQQTQPSADGKPISVNAVTLLLQPEDAEKLVLATSSGSIYFVLRNGGDKQQATTKPVGFEQLAGMAAPVAPTPVIASVAAPPPAPASAPAAHAWRYKVETILGDKQVVEGFY
jgi:pilus assembly protein CpaB